MSTPAFTSASKWWIYKAHDGKWKASAPEDIYEKTRRGLTFEEAVQYVKEQIS